MNTKIGKSVTNKIGKTKLLKKIYKIGLKKKFYKFQNKKKLSKKLIFFVNCRFTCKIIKSYQLDEKENNVSLPFFLS